jgi:hypothetical protein
MLSLVHCIIPLRKISLRATGLASTLLHVVFMTSYNLGGLEDSQDTPTSHHYICNNMALLGHECQYLYIYSIGILCLFHVVPLRRTSKDPE